MGTCRDTIPMVEGNYSEKVFVPTCLILQFASYVYLFLQHNATMNCKSVRRCTTIEPALPTVNRVSKTIMNPRGYKRCMHHLYPEPIYQREVPIVYATIYSVQCDHIEDCADLGAAKRYC